MSETIERSPEKEAGKEILLTDEERQYLKELIVRERVQAKLESPQVPTKKYRLLHFLLRKFE